MGDWTEGLQNALEYIEANLTNELEVREIAKRAFVSPFISRGYLLHCAELVLENTFATAD